MRYPIFLTTIFFAGLCHAGSTAAIDEQSPHQVPPIGSTLQLHRSLAIPADDAGVTIQDGKESGSTWQLNQYRTHCDFELKSRSDRPRTVAPQTFTITRVVRDYENVMLQGPVQVAAVGFHAGVDGGPPMENNMLIMYLAASTDLDVLRMTCQHWMDASTDTPVTIADVRVALGDLFTLTLASGQAR